MALYILRTVLFRYVFPGRFPITGRPVRNCCGWRRWLLLRNIAFCERFAFVEWNSHVIVATLRQQAVSCGWSTDVDCVLRRSSFPAALYCQRPEVDTRQVICFQIIATFSLDDAAAVEMKNAKCTAFAWHFRWSKTLPATSYQRCCDAAAFYWRRRRHLTTIIATTDVVLGAFVVWDEKQCSL